MEKSAYQARVKKGNYTFSFKDNITTNTQNKTKTQINQIRILNINFLLFYDTNHGTTMSTSTLRIFGKSVLQVLNLIKIAFEPNTVIIITQTDKN